MTTEKPAASAEPTVDPQRPPDPALVALRHERSPLRVSTKVEHVTQRHDAAIDALDTPGSTLTMIALSSGRHGGG